MASIRPPATPESTMVVDMGNCAREAIHQIQMVQPHGFLVACDVGSGRITHISENARDHLELGHADMVGRSVFGLFLDSPEAILALLASVRTGSPLLSDLRFRAGATPSEHFEVLAHRVGTTVVIEGMPLLNASVVSADERGQIEEMVKTFGELHLQKTLGEFLHACVEQIRHLSGFQRVFIYRFLPDWSGEVIAESAQEGFAARFLGLRFPASDIPEQARTLYRTNLLRVIGDVDAAPVALLSEPGGALLDQSNSLLRSPSPMHLLYLQNMGVRSTMTISLLKDGELWGMVSCHHDVPLLLPVQLRRMTKLLCALLAEVAVVRLDAMLHQEAITKSLRARQALVHLIREMGSGEQFPVLVEKTLHDVSAAMKIGARGLMVAGQWLCPLAIDPDLLAWLLHTARGLRPDGVFATDCLALETALDAALVKPWAGALVLRIPGPADSFLIFLRNEVVQEVKWGGAPVKVPMILANGLQVLGPRQSFDSWTEVMREKSEPWTAEDTLVVLDVAKALGDAHQAYSRQLLQSELRMLGACMEHLNDIVVVTDAVALNEPGPIIVYVNQAFVTKTGYTREEAVGRSPRFLQGPATDRVQLDVLRLAMQAWSPVTVEVINYKKNGEPFWLELSLAPITDRTGRYTHWVAIERDIDERKRSEAAMRQLANFDPLTGLPNRRLLMDRLPLALSVSKRYERNGALLVVDLDNFKDLNDTQGHHVGDELLKQVAQRLVRIVRLEDTVARIGGDEFVVMLENLSADTVAAAASAQGVAEKIIAALAHPFELGEQSHRCTGSLGISLFHDSQQPRSMEDLLKQADFAMYQAKTDGRNTWRFFDPGTRAALVAKNGLEADLRLAFANGELSLHYQPIVNASRTIVGVEALMRWQHATRGWVSPLEFIPIAESTGLIVLIGQWAIAQACGLLGTWSTDPLRAGWSIAVNVSARQIHQADFVGMVEGLIGEAGCAPALLKLELTESMLQHDFDTTIAKMEQLRAVGVAFSIDDFGTGYSSLAYLQRLPISVLKIDRSFVREIGKNAGADAGDVAICKMILALGKSLGLSIVAEGVETLEQYDFLKAHHCDKFQGYLFSKALPVDSLGTVAAQLHP